jgi:hypothetical protein
MSSEVFHSKREGIVSIASRPTSAGTSQMSAGHAHGETNSKGAITGMAAVNEVGAIGIAAALILPFLRRMRQNQYQTSVESISQESWHFNGSTKVELNED